MVTPYFSIFRNNNDIYALVRLLHIHVSTCTKLDGGLSGSMIPKMSWAVSDETFEGD